MTDDRGKEGAERQERPSERGDALGDLLRRQQRAKHKEIADRMFGSASDADEGERDGR
jgi:hypothetical protein